MDEPRQPVAKKFCSECPFRKNAAPGWLGGGQFGGAEDYRRLAHSDANVACHKSAGYATGDASRMRPCAGLALYRANVCKSPTHPDASAAVAALYDSPHRAEVFQTPAEFMERHDNNLNRRLMTRLRSERAN